MQRHPCVCTYVPPFVLERLARRATDEQREGIRASIYQSKASRDGRALQLVGLGGTPSVSARSAFVEGLGATGSATRTVYDCQNQWSFQVSLARDEGGPSTGNSDVDEVYEFAGVVRDFFQKELNRSSIDNLGMNLILNVHYGTSYMNAFWDGTQMTFGDGDGSIFTSFARSLDVTAHELAHGITQHTAGLDYYSQPGALNEHFSDVFGSVITQYQLGQNAGEADWLIGNEIMGPTLFGEALRSMNAPGSAYDNPMIGSDPQPSHMSDYYGGPADNQGVHINSGIPNRSFALVALDIGTLDATRIWYQALQNLWPTADFAAAADVLTESARILVKNHVVPEGSTQTVRLALKEVGIL